MSTLEYTCSITHDAATVAIVPTTQHPSAVIRVGLRGSLAVVASRGSLVGGMG